MSMTAPSSADVVRRAMTVQEWSSLPEDEPGELVDGWLVAEEMPDGVHETVVAWLVEVLRRWLRPRGGRAFGSELRYAVSERRGRKPDVSAWFPNRTVPGRGVVRVPPNLAVEVVSRRPEDSRRDRIEKPPDYALFGIHWYWLLDPEARTLEILELGPDGRYVRALGASAGVVSPVPGCEGLALDLDALWAEIDELETP
jgi:Uma2 family endonuclease